MSNDDDREEHVLRRINKTFESTIQNRGLHFGIEFYNRIKLFPWWLHYHKGDTIESEIRNNILKIGCNLGLDQNWLKNILRHTVSEFSKKGLGSDYYGYHNIQHELEAALFVLIVIDGINRSKTNAISNQDMKYLFVAALFHDYDPLKKFDKPNEDSVEYFIRNDSKIRKFIEKANLNLDTVMALIHRTAYPFEGKIAEHSRVKIDRLLDSALTSSPTERDRERYFKLGWLLSVSERIAGYALGDYEHAKDMARRNAHALGWHPSVINKNSVKYFEQMMLNEKEMFEMVMSGLPSNLKQNFYHNVSKFKDAWNKEIGVRDLKKGTKLVFTIENMSQLETETLDALMDIRKTVPTLIHVDEKDFTNSLLNDRTLLVTLRIESSKGKIVGYAKGGPLEQYLLRPGTVDPYFGLMNTAYLEGVSVTEGFWGGMGGHFLRIKFLNEAINDGYSFVTGYAHRDVILQRKKKLELIEIVQRHDPDKLDYYRIDLNNSLYQEIVTDTYDLIC
ncbi:hypothetical protein [Candidatus Nitrosocosmicus franklandus]|uniref:Uncharacterized protein n=1 Tax=Candidatus Nitrosocosmicus franklandianus TaxID=1798806 RepID=A0A484IAH1_9ARCH|nr:hypothetical protein [Candidatus Nitrosocosmicus franklandus]VFJ12677.1 conserved protein of unknown function [Candidatus Nitrosocosmicus franklandus]